MECQDPIMFPVVPYILFKTGKTLSCWKIRNPALKRNSASPFKISPGYAEGFERSNTTGLPEERYSLPRGGVLSAPKGGI